MELIDKASRTDLLRALDLLDERVRRQRRRKFWTYFPESGPFRRELYPRHMEFFRLGADHSTRCFMAANRVGKTEGGGGYEATAHLTGYYPEWWQGRRFNEPIEAWAAGDTGETVRDIIQAKMVGKKGEEGTALIPGDAIVDVSYRRNSNDALDYVDVQRYRQLKSGNWDKAGVSRLAFKSYEQGRKSFQGTEKHLIWLDEESDEGIRAECALRLMTTHGLLIETFTPLKGLTPIVLTYLNEGRPPADGNRTVTSDDRALVMAGWDDVPHLSEDAKTRMYAESEVHLREARSKGVPSIGSGAIYPIHEEEIVCDPIELPDHWPRAYGMDVGWKRTAVIWGAFDRETNTWYLYSEHYRGQAEPSIHADAIKGRGDWIPGVIDPASRGRTQDDGEKLLEMYTDLGLDLMPANNAREAGIHKVYQDLSTGKMKVFRTLTNWLGEYRIYRRDQKGAIVKENDHLMDATRYLKMSGEEVMKTKPSGGPSRRRSSNWRTA